MSKPDLRDLSSWLGSKALKCPLALNVYASKCGVIVYESGIEARLYDNPDGYRVVVIKTDAGKRTVGVHRMVASAWCAGYAPGLQANHKDGNKKNNHADNLEWVTPRGNVQHAIDTGLRSSFKGQTNVKAILRDTDIPEIKRMLAAGTRPVDIAAQYGVSATRICDIKNGHNWKHLMTDGEVTKKRTPLRGPRFPTSLSDDAIADIRKRLANGEIGMRLAEEYGVSFQYISDVKLNKTRRTKLT